MIARVWKASATVSGAQEYATYFQSTVVPELSAIPGYRGVMLFESAYFDRVEVTVLTRWDSIDAIRAFAGESITTAVVHDRAARMLIDFDPTVTHHEVVFDVWHQPLSSELAP